MLKHNIQIDGVIDGSQGGRRIGRRERSILEVDFKIIIVIFFLFIFRRTFRERSQVRKNGAGNNDVDGPNLCAMTM